LVEVQGENGMEECGHIMGTDSSTGNFIVHLACKHGITEETHKRKTQEMGKDKKGNQQIISLTCSELIQLLKTAVIKNL
jgi:hypothetical protein